LKIEVHSHPRNVEADWRTLEQQGGCTVFQRFDWSGAWFDAASQDPTIAPLIVLVRDSVGACVMILPLVCHAANGLRTIGFADLGVCDYNAPLIAPQFEPNTEQLRQLWRRIRHVLPAHDLLFLEKMPRQSANQLNPLVDMTGVDAYVQNAVGTPIDRGQGDDVTVYFSSKFAPKMRERLRKLVKKAPVQFAMAQDGATQARYMELFTRNFAEKSAVDPTFNDVLGHPYWRNLYLTSLHGAAPAARVGALLIDGEEAALCFGLLHQGAYHLILHTYLGQRWKNHSPGLQLIHHTMQWALDEGLQYFDFTLGAEAYKLDFGGVELPLYQLAQAGSLRGYWPVFKLRAKGYLRRHPQLQQWLKRTVAKVRT
jgi:CelD/BcsL family acetyltransferase involved in cellulose biosynthesis